MNAMKLCILGIFAIAATTWSASIGILVEKASELLNAPIEGFKSVAGADATVFDMANDPATGTSTRLHAALPTG